MNIIPETVALVVLFLLRLGVPIGVTVLIAWGLRRLDGRWQAEAEAQQTSRAVAAGTLEPASVQSPLLAKQNCWEVRHCTPDQHAGCPACSVTDIPCWMARLRADGKLPALCYGCALFRTRPPLQPVAASVPL